MSTASFLEWERGREQAERDEAERWLNPLQAEVLNALRELAPMSSNVEASDIQFAIKTDVSVRGVANALAALDRRGLVRGLSHTSGSHITTRWELRETKVLAE